MKSRVAGRPMALKRFVNGAEGEAFFQKRAPASRPEWTDTVVLSFPSGRTAEEVVVVGAPGPFRGGAGVSWTRGAPENRRVSGGGAFRGAAGGRLHGVIATAWFTGRLVGMSLEVAVGGYEE